MGEAPPCAGFLSQTMNLAEDVLHLVALFLPHSRALATTARSLYRRLAYHTVSLRIDGLVSVPRLIAVRPRVIAGRSRSFCPEFATGGPGA